MTPARSQARRLAVGLSICLVLGGCLQTGRLADYEPKSPATPQEMIDRGTFLLRTGEPENAYKLFVEALGTGGNPAMALTGIGLALEAQGMLLQARSHLEKARDLAPGSPTAHNNLGVVHYKLRDYGAARAAFLAAFAVSSGKNEIARQNLLLAERRMAELTPLPDPLVTHGVQRLGGGVYRLAAVPAPDAPLPVPDILREATEAGPGDPGEQPDGTEGEVAAPLPVAEASTDPTGWVALSQSQATLTSGVEEFAALEATAAEPSPTGPEIASEPAAEGEPTAPGQPIAEPERTDQAAPAPLEDGTDAEPPEAPEPTLANAGAAASAPAAREGVSEDTAGDGVADVVTVPLPATP